jgi:hypothetical protein
MFQGKFTDDGFLEKFLCGKKLSCCLSVYNAKNSLSFYHELDKKRKRNYSLNAEKTVTNIY